MKSSVLPKIPVADMRRAAWLNLDKFSTTWIPAWPDRDAYLSNAEFGEVAPFYYGLPSPACAMLIGERIGATRTVLDEHGCNLATATLPGDGWRTQHDAIKWRIAGDMAEMQARAATEVYGLFAAYIPQQGRARLDGETARKRQGLVPDFLLYADWGGPERPFLLELKTLHFGTSTYSHEARRCDAVARRARAVPAEYVTKARITDQRYCGTPLGELGPVSHQLQTYDRVRGLVFGSWAEASPDVEQLLGTLARKGAAHHWRELGCQSDATAVGTLAWMLRRRWGITALRENARLKLERLAFVGRGAAAAASRRLRAASYHAARAGRAIGRQHSMRERR